MTRNLASSSAAEGVPTFAGYRMIEKLSEGGMGVVFLAEHVHLNRLAAVKVLRNELARDPEFRARFLRESRAVAGLDHPNVIPIFDAGEAGSSLFVAMRYVRGGDLTRFRSKGALSPVDACPIIEQAAAGLHAAHESGLVHRDVKPANLLVEEREKRWHVYVSDFGIVKPLGETSFTSTGAIVGTIQYIAPEQIRGQRVSPATDVYSLGCVAFELLTGRPPFVRETEYGLLHAHLSDPAPGIPDHLGISTSIRHAVAKAMHKDPLARYQSMDRFARAFGD